MIKQTITDVVTSFVYSIRILFHLNPKKRLAYSKNHNGIIHIFGNGPSLKKVLGNHDFNMNNDVVFVVNDFAVSEFYSKVKPKYYMFVDPAYWSAVVNEDDKKMREEVYLSLNEKTKWPMTLFVPSNVINKQYLKQSIRNTNIHLHAFNYVNFYPTRSIFYKFVLKNNFGVVPVGNILGQAIYAGINMGYDEIYIYGAEHSWTEDIRVNDNNEVCTIKKHFFDNGENALVPWRKSSGEVFKMHEILTSLRNHFYGYHYLDWYSKQMRVKIFNCTPGSFIDAFERKQIQE